KFDKYSASAFSWWTYPSIDITGTPEKIDFVLINHPELPPTGAGEPSIRPVAAAIANAIFDATGVRIRRVPFSPDRVKQSLSRHDPVAGPRTPTLHPLWAIKAYSVSQHLPRSAKTKPRASTWSSSPAGN